MSIVRAIIALVAAAPCVAFAAPSDYRLDTVHTQVAISVRHMGFSRPGGRLHVKSGWFRFDPDDWSSAKVEAVIDAASIDFGDAAWNDKLRSREFLDAAHHATAQFVSDRVEKTGEKTAIIHGKLSLLGMTRRVYTYASGLGWDGLNLAISIAAFFFAAGTLTSLYNVVR